MKLLAVVSGGDAPGINAALFHLAEAARHGGHVLIGAVGGLPGILREAFVPLEPSALAPLAGLGGSWLKTSREPVLKAEDNRAALRAVCERYAIDGVILFGGGGTLTHIPPLLAALSIRMVGIPTTIDNDVPGTALTLGFHSAVDFAYHAIDGIRATANALEGRLFTLETLGGDSGVLALEAAYGAGADGVILPEYPNFDRDHLVMRLRAAIDRKGHALLVYNEYVRGKNELIEQIAAAVGTRLRDTRLGHAQRGGTPVHMDRLLARAWADGALNALEGAAQTAITIWDADGAGVREGLPGRIIPQPDAARYARVNGLDELKEGQ
ncbi:MAG: 6-phosphofructokinase [bacterium]|nr:6-phosphofructokinase [bacterium]